MNARIAVPLALALCSLGACTRDDLTLDPAVLEDCGPGPGKVIRVAWDAQGAGGAGVQLEVLRPGGEPTPWTKGLLRGSKSTGPWGSDGLTFILLAADGHELSRKTVTTIPCKVQPAARGAVRDAKIRPRLP